MEGKVTISLKDYEVLKEQAEIKERYLNTAISQVTVLEKVEQFLKTGNRAPGLLKEVTNILDNWYG